MLAFVRRKGSADTVSTSPSSSVDGGDDLSVITLPPPPPPKERRWKKRSLSLLQRSSGSSTSSTGAGKDAFEPAAVASTAPASTALVTDKDAAVLLAANSSLASHVVWKLAMRMSLHNESRFLQHLSRSMLSRGTPHKHAEKHLEGDEQPPPAHASWPTLNQKLLGGSAASGSTCGATPVGAGKAPCTPLPALPPLPPLHFAQPKGAAPAPALLGSTLESYEQWAFPGLRPALSVRVVRAEVIASVPAVTEYVVHVEDLHTKVFWVTKKRFHELYLLRKKIKALAKQAAGDDADALKFLLELPFPRRRFRQPSLEAAARRCGELEAFLRNAAALPPASESLRAALRALQLEMCSAEFIASLEQIDTRGEPAAPKWLAVDLFRWLNCARAGAGAACHQFVRAFASRCAVLEAAVCPACRAGDGAALAAEALRELRAVVSRVEQHVLAHLPPSHAAVARARELVARAVEDAVVAPLERALAFLVDATTDRAAEARLARNLERLRGTSQGELGIPEHLQSDDDWGRSCHHLSMIDERALPCDKIDELLRAALEVFRSCGEKELAWRENSALTADDYLPIHIYVVAKSGLKRPLRTKEYLGAMIHPSKMLGEVGYFLTMFEVALKYIADM